MKPTPTPFRLSDHELLMTGKGCMPFRFDPPSFRESCLDVPPIVHQIWLGDRTDDPLPEKYKVMRAELEAHNPEWNFILWGNVDHFKMHNADLFNAEKNPGAKSDLLRYEVVHRFGGVYLDIDFKSHGPGSMHPDMFRSWTTVSGHPWYNCNNAHYGYAQGSEFLAYCIKNLRDPRVRRETEAPARMGPTFYTTCLLSFGDMRLVHPEGRVIMEKLEHLCDANWVGKG